MPFIGKENLVGQYALIDAITPNGSTSYTLQIDGVNYEPESPRNLIVSVNGVTQAPVSSYTVSGSTITFAEAIQSSDSIDYILVLGHVLDIGVPSDNSVGFTQLKDGGIQTIKIADDQIDSEHYVDGSIDTAHIGDSQVTLAKLASDSVNSSKIVDGSIVNADINASAAIDATKIHDGTISNTEFGYLNGVTSAIQTQIDGKVNTSDIGSTVQAYDAELAAIAGLTSAADKGIQFTGSGTAATYDLTTAGKALLDDADASAQRTTLGLGTISTQAANNVAVTGGSITGLGDPSVSSEAATKNYVDQLIAGLRTRIVAEVATTANVDLTADLQNGDTIDGVTLVTGDRVLVKDQTTGSQNGLYTVVASGTASRDTEYDTIAELSGQMVVVNQGTVNDNKIFLCTTNNTATLDSDTITFTQITPANVGTVTSVGVADAGSSEFTVANSPITSSGTITLAVNSIAATKIGNGDVDNTELSYVNGVTSAIQTQLDAKATNGFAIAMAIAL